MKPLLSLSMWVLFVAGLIGCVDSRHFVHATQHQHLIHNLGGIALSLAAGSYVMRREPLKSWLKTRKVMWFLFLFNLAVALVAPLPPAWQPGRRRRRRDGDCLPQRRPGPAQKPRLGLTSGAGMRSVGE